MVSLGLAPAAAAQPATLPATQPRPVVFAEGIRAEDRLLFVGDEMTQQMFYTRGVAAALLAVKPDWNLRFFNGGYEGATAGSASKWIDGLLTLTKPTVVLICLGLNDAVNQDSRRAYPDALAALVERVRAEPTVRTVFIVSPPALDRADDTLDRFSADNKTMGGLVQAAERVAAQKGAGFIDLFSPLRRVYIDSHKTEGNPLSLGNRLPSEEGHIVVASVVLRGVGVTAAMLEPVGWSPLRPLQMRRVRQALALRLKAPPLEAAERSGNLYSALGRFDEQFFRLWRLAGRHDSAAIESAQTATEKAWSDVLAAVEPYRPGGRAGVPASSRKAGG